MHTFATPAPISTVLEIPAGRIRILAADRADTTVEILPADSTRTRDVIAAERIQVTYDDGVLRVAAAEATNPALGSSGRVEITVQVPTGSRVRATTASAELRGVGRLGEVTVDNASGPVELDETTSAQLTLQSGDVSIGRLTGPAQISTQKGDLTITEALTGTLTLHTEYGHITLGAAPDTSATLDANTTFGRIHNALKNTDGPTAALNVHATTAHGDITARSL
jgi:DUF4097 and DUF4098 domain-containing protein YvlB